jgi:poly(hydroxyalkanoate) granule-associated protein
MVKKAQKTDASKQASTDIAPAPLADAIKDSAHQIWLAGLGAFSKAQEEGNKAFEVLVKEGLSIQRQTQAAAEEQISEATHRVSDMANDLSSRAVGQWDKLENIFEDRVAKSLHKLGVPNARDMALLMERIDTLSAAVQELSQATCQPVQDTAVAAPVAETTEATASTPTKTPRKAAAKTTSKAPRKAAKD